VTKRRRERKEQWGFYPIWTTAPPSGKEGPLPQGLRYLQTGLLLLWNLREIAAQDSKEKTNDRESLGIWPCVL
jgi:hypothetical protein